MCNYTLKHPSLVLGSRLNCILLIICNGPSINTIGIPNCTCPTCNPIYARSFVFETFLYLYNLYKQFKNDWTVDVWQWGKINDGYCDRSWPEGIWLCSLPRGKAWGVPGKCMVRTVWFSIRGYRLLIFLLKKQNS